MKALLLALACTYSQAQTTPQTCPHASRIALDSGTFSPKPGVTFTLHHFVATLVPRTNVLPTCLEKDTVMTRGEIFVSNQSLTEVFTSKLSNTESKIKDFKVEKRHRLGHPQRPHHQARPHRFLDRRPRHHRWHRPAHQRRQNQGRRHPHQGPSRPHRRAPQHRAQAQRRPRHHRHRQSTRLRPRPDRPLKGHIASVQTTDKGIILRYTTPRAQPTKTKQTIKIK